jgi:hypothetical protein
MLITDQIRLFEPSLTALGRNNNHVVTPFATKDPRQLETPHSISRMFSAFMFWKTDTTLI